jgi:hypothetical protein
MAIRRLEPSVSMAEFAAALLSEQEAAPRAQIPADKVRELLPDGAVIVYVVMDQQNPAWTAKAAAGGISVAEVLGFHEGTLGVVAENKTRVVFEGANLRRENYAHLDVRCTVSSLAYVPLVVETMRVGTIELISYERSFLDLVLQTVTEMAEFTSPALAIAVAYESERNASLQSISRVPRCMTSRRSSTQPWRWMSCSRSLPKSFRKS